MGPPQEGTQQANLPRRGYWDKGVTVSKQGIEPGYFHFPGNQQICNPNCLQKNFLLHILKLLAYNKIW